MKTDIVIIGAGPVGIFAAFQAGMLGMKSCVVDVLDMPGGQCSELYPEKPIYDIPAYKEILAQGLVDNLCRYERKSTVPTVHSEISIPFSNCGLSLKQQQVRKTEFRMVRIEQKNFEGARFPILHDCSFASIRSFL